MKSLRSRQLLDQLSPKAVEIIGQPGKLRDKWPLLDEDDKRILEEALEVARKEAEEIGKQLEKMEGEK
jgi:hypothetical protein